MDAHHNTRIIPSLSSVKVSSYRSRQLIMKGGRGECVDMSATGVERVQKKERSRRNGDSSTKYRYLQQSPSSLRLRFWQHLSPNCFRPKEPVDRNEIC